MQRLAPVRIPIFFIVSITACYSFGGNAGEHPFSGRRQPNILHDKQPQHVKKTRASYSSRKRTRPSFRVAFAPTSASPTTQASRLAYHLQASKERLRRLLNTLSTGTHSNSGRDERMRTYFVLLLDTSGQHPPTPASRDPSCSTARSWRHPSPAST